MGTRLRRVGGWLLGGVLAGVAIMPICDLHFDCGCGWPGFGGFRHCDIHTPGPPDCPWCDYPAGFVVSMLFAYGVALFGVIRLPERTHFAVAVLLSLVIVLAASLFAGVVTSLVTGRTPLAGL